MTYSVSSSSKEVFGLFGNSLVSFKESEPSSTKVYVKCSFSLTVSVCREKVVPGSFMDWLSIRREILVSCTESLGNGGWLIPVSV